MSLFRMNWQRLSQQIKYLTLDRLKIPDSILDLTWKNNYLKNDVLIHVKFGFNVFSEIIMIVFTELEQS